MDRNFVTPSGTTVHIRTGAISDVRNRDAKAIPFEMSSAGTTLAGRVIFDAIPHMSALLMQDLQRPFTRELAGELAPIAVLAAVDEDPAFFSPDRSAHDIEIGPGNVQAYLHRPRLGDREIRRYVARRVYDAYSRADLDALVEFDELDRWITGTQAGDFVRNVQVLADEGHLRLHRSMGGKFSVQATAKLVREVERFGSAKDDVESGEDFLRLIQGQDRLKEWRDAIVLEYNRYSAAVSRLEIESVFRATAPIVEDVLRQRLRELGLTRELPTLGVMIGEMQSRRIGTTHLYSQLNHILKFARDLEQHGGRLADAVLRIATANAFELLPQIANL